MVVRSGLGVLIMVVTCATLVGSTRTSGFVTIVVVSSITELLPTVGNVFGSRIRVVIVFVVVELEETAGAGCWTTASAVEIAETAAAGTAGV